jgi:hypothetical protein
MGKALGFLKEGGGGHGFDVRTSLLYGGLGKNNRGLSVCLINVALCPCQTDTDPSNTSSIQRKLIWQQQRDHRGYRTNTRLSYTRPQQCACIMYVMYVCTYV